MDHILTFTPSQLRLAEAMAGDLTLAPLEPEPRHTSNEILRDQLLHNVRTTARLHANACDASRPRHLIDHYWQAHCEAVEAYRMAFGRKPERLGGVWM